MNHTNHSHSTQLHLEKPTDFQSMASIATCWLSYRQEFLFLQYGPQTTPDKALLWGVPGGKIEPNETPAQAVVREIWEETSVQLEEPKLLDLRHFYISKPNWRFTYHMFAYVLQNKPIVRLSPEHQDYAWLTLEKVSTLCVIPGVLETIEIFKNRVLEQEHVCMSKL